MGMPLRLSRANSTITPRKPAGVEHGDRGMPEQVLHLLWRQLTTAARLRIDAPRRKEIPESVRGVFGLAVRIDDVRSPQGRLQGR